MFFAYLAFVLQKFVQCNRFGNFGKPKPHVLYCSVKSLQNIQRRGNKQLVAGAQYGMSGWNRMVTVLVADFDNKIL